MTPQLTPFSKDFGASREPSPEVQMATSRSEEVSIGVRFLGAALYTGLSPDTDRTVYDASGDFKGAPAGQVAVNNEVVTFAPSPANGGAPANETVTYIPPAANPVDGSNETLTFTPAPSAPNTVPYDPLEEVRSAVKTFSLPIAELNRGIEEANR